MSTRAAPEQCGGRVLVMVFLRCGLLPGRRTPRPTTQTTRDAPGTPSAGPEPSDSASGPSMGSSATVPRPRARVARPTPDVRTEPARLIRPRRPLSALVLPVVRSAPARRDHHARSRRFRLAVPRAAPGPDLGRRPARTRTRRSEQAGYAPTHANLSSRPEPPTGPVRARTCRRRTSSSATQPAVVAHWPPDCACGEAQARSTSSSSASSMACPAPGGGREREPQPSRRTRTSPAAPPLGHSAPLDRINPPALEQARAVPRVGALLDAQLPDRVEDAQPVSRRVGRRPQKRVSRSGSATGRNAAIRSFSGRRVVHPHQPRVAELIASEHVHLRNGRTARDNAPRTGSRPRGPRRSCWPPRRRAGRLLRAVPPDTLDGPENAPDATGASHSGRQLHAATE